METQHADGIRVVEPIVLDREGHEVPGTGPQHDEWNQSQAQGPQVRAISLGGPFAWLMGLLLPLLLISGFAIFAVVALTVIAFFILRGLFRALLR